MRVPVSLQKDFVRPTIYIIPVWSFIKDWRLLLYKRKKGHFLSQNLYVFVLAYFYFLAASQASCLTLLRDSLASRHKYFPGRCARADERRYYCEVRGSLLIARIMDANRAAEDRKAPAFCFCFSIGPRRTRSHRSPASSSFSPVSPVPVRGGWKCARAFVADFSPLCMNLQAIAARHTCQATCCHSIGWRDGGVALEARCDHSYAAPTTAAQSAASQSVPSLRSSGCILDTASA